MRASALTYTTVLSFVPFLAIAFSVVKGLGVQNTLEPLLVRLLGNSSSELASRIMLHVNNTNVKSLGMIGVLMLFVTVITLLSSIEEAFNVIWGVGETRSLKRRFSDYLSVAVFGPLLIVAAMSMTSSMQSQSLVKWLIQNTFLGNAILSLFSLLPYLSVWAALTFLYIYIPNAQVRFRSAVIGGVIAGTAWQIAQWGYFHFQIGVSGYNAIYGALATLPVFLVWIYTSWMIVLIGLEIVKAHQNPSAACHLSEQGETRRLPSMRRRLFINRQKFSARRKGSTALFLSIVLFCFSLFALLPSYSIASPASIKVVMDNNYPPYIFKGNDGKLQGILVDHWSLWEKKTGIKAEIHAMDWAEAQRRMLAGEFDLIDTIFKTAEREDIYSFSASYANIDVPVFFDCEITGIKDVSSLDGFKVAAKEGDAAVDFLRKNGVKTVLLYPSYESIISAARDKKVSVFMMDHPPALYLLHKFGINEKFRHTKPLYSGRFHRAVLKANSATLKLVEDGFSKISADEYRAIEERWSGASTPGIVRTVWIFYGIGFVLLVVAVLVLWNRTLHRMVEKNTEELRTSEAKYRDLVQKAGSIILRWNSKGVINFINDYGLDFFGFSQDEVVGRHICESILPELQSDGRNLRKMLDDIFSTPDLFIENTHQNIRKTGERVWISWSNQPIFDEYGSLLEMLSIGSDVSARQAVEDALYLSEERFRVFISQAPDAILQGDREGIIVGANSMAEELTGYSNEELIGTNISRFFSSEELERNPLRYDLLNAGEQVRAERLFLRKDGSIVPVEMNSKMMPDGTYQAFIRDFSDRKKIEEELIKARASAEAASEAKSLFLANMSHEIRTPLNAIIGINSIMQERLEPGELRDLVCDSSIAARNLLEIISDVLDISKIEAGKLKVVIIPFELRLIVSQLERMFSMLATEKGIELDVSMSSGLPSWLTGDPARIQQIGVNLLSNAIKFTEHGKVSLQVSGSQDGDRDFILSLAITDSGKGISPENIEKIFSPFVQEDLTTTRKYGGTGLGLAISLHLARLMGGGIEVESRPGDGSTFRCTVRCSLTTPIKQRMQQAVSSKIPLRQLKILVAEDSLVNRKMMEAILRMERHNARFVENGIEAFAAWREEKFDLILMDIQMPEMDGMQATEAIRKAESESGEHIPIVALTAYAMSGDKERFMASGMDGYLAKPITVEQLREALIAHGSNNSS